MRARRMHLPLHLLLLLPHHLLRHPFLLLLLVSIPRVLLLPSTEETTIVPEMRVAWNSRERQETSIFGETRRGRAVKRRPRRFSWNAEVFARPSRISHAPAVTLIYDNVTPGLISSNRVRLAFLRYTFPVCRVNKPPCVLSIAAGCQRLSHNCVPPLM